MARQRPRQRRKRILSPRFIVACEGRRTEYEYLTRLDKAVARGGKPAVSVLRGGGLDAVRVVKKAIRQREEDRRSQMFSRRDGDMVFALLDVEPHDPSKVGALDKALRLANREGVCVLLSNPCFEFWLFCHVADERQACRGFEDPTALDRALRRHGFDKDTLHASSSGFDRLLNNVKGAVRVARHVHERHHANVADIRHANACTTVYQLVARMIGV